MAKNATNPVTPELEAKALSVVGSPTNLNEGWLPGLLAEPPKVGDVVSCWGHNKQRIGVVTEVTKTRVHVLFTTPGAIDEAQRITAHAVAESTDLASYIARQRPTFTSNYLFDMEEARVETAKYGMRTVYENHKPVGKEVDTEHLVRHADRLSYIEDEGFEALLTAQAQDSLDRANRSRVIPWQDRVGYTHSWKKITDVYVQMGVVA